MPAENYGVLKGKATRRAFDRGDRTPHYHILVETDSASFHVAVNIRSGLDHVELLYAIDDEFEHPLTGRIDLLPAGFTRLPNLPNSGALDYVRGQVVDRKRFRTATRARRGEGGLADIVDVHIRRAVSDPDATLYAFGTRWGPRHRETDRTFRGHPIHPSDGIHDVHMNQGNPDRPGHRDDHFFRENGPWQDGGLLLQLPSIGQWIGIFLAFQSQVWETDDRTGRPVSHADRTGAPRGMRRGEPDQSVKIVAAMVNPVGPSPERETVTLLNPTSERIDLAGWTLVNSDQQATRLHGVIPPRDTISVDVSPSAPLGNRGGTIQLVNDAGVKVHGVAYTERQSRREGWMLTF